MKRTAIRTLACALLVLSAASASPVARAGNAGEAERLRARARAAIERHDYREAANILDRAFKADPSKTAILKDLAVVLAEGGKIDESVARYRQYLKLVPSDDAAMLAMATTLSWSKDKSQLQEADALLTDYLAKHPDADESLLQRARVRSWMGQSKASETDFRAYLAKYPNAAKVKLELAMALSGRKDDAAFVEAIRIYDAHLVTSPNDFAIVLQRARVHSWAGHTAEATTDYRAYVKAQPEDEAALLELARELSWSKRPEDVREAMALIDRHLTTHPDDKDALLQRGRARSWSGQTAEAIADYRAYLAAKPDETVTLELARVLSRSVRRQDVEEGVALLDRHLAQHPEDEEAILDRARARSSSQPAIALAAFRANLKKHPEDEKARLELAGALSRSKDKALLAEALGLYDAHLARHPDDFAILLQRGRVRGWVGMTKEAADDLRAYAYKNPKDDAVQLEMANVVAQGSDPSAAIPLYDAYLVRHPSDVEARTRRARTLLWAGDFVKAETALGTLRSEARTNVARNELDVDLARLYAQTGRRYDAVELLDEVLARTPDHLDARSEQARVALYLGSRVQPKLFYYVDKSRIAVGAATLEGRAALSRNVAILADVGAWSLGNAAETLGAGRANLGAWTRIRFLELEAAAGPRIYQHFEPKLGVRAAVRVTPTPWANVLFAYQYDDIYFDMLQPASVSVGVRGHAAHLTADVTLPLRIRATGRVGSRFLLPENRSLEMAGTVHVPVFGPLSVGYNVQYLTWRSNDASYWSPQAFAAHLLLVRITQDFYRSGFSYELQAVGGIAGERIEGAPQQGFGPSFGGSGVVTYSPIPRLQLRLGAQYSQTIRELARDVQGGSGAVNTPVQTATEPTRYWWVMGTASAMIYF